MRPQLQLILGPEELADIAAAAQRRGRSVDEWARDVLREAARPSYRGYLERPDSDIDSILGDIERGRGL